MRKSGVYFIIIFVTLLLFINNYYIFFNIIALFLLVGAIAGTKLSIPEAIMFCSMIVALLSLLVYLIKNEKFYINFIRYINSIISKQIRIKQITD